MSGPDQRALRVAREVHRREQPLAPILFGSRARGDHREETSDIDILLVGEKLPDGLHDGRAARAAREDALRAYGREVQTQLLWVTLAEFRHDEPYLNSIATRAVLEGVVFSDLPQHFRSRYDRPDPPPPRYRWNDYQHHLQAARTELGMIGNLPAGSEDTEPMQDGAAIAGTGAVPRDHAGIPELEDRLAELAPLENRHTRIPLRDYARGRMPRGMSQREFAEAVHEDVNRIRKLAMRLRRRTGRAAR